jgi:hypothetical protein
MHVADSEVRTHYSLLKAELYSYLMSALFQNTRAILFEGSSLSWGKWTNLLNCDLQYVF